LQSPRDSRLQAEHEKVQRLIAESGGTLKLVRASGSPPTSYVIEFHCPSLVKGGPQQVTIRNIHQVEFNLGANYPSSPPTARFLTSVFNPHVFQHNAVCLGVLQNSWNVSLTLDIVILEIGALLQLDPKVLNPNSPANHEANKWVQENRNRIPLGTISFKTGQERTKRIQWS
jgi:ubiquitin-protein ligase